MLMKDLSIENLIEEAQVFCKSMSLKNHIHLIGVTDGKAVGTYTEHEFKKFLQNRYVFSEGNSAKGIDFPDENILTDIKVTSIVQLGYNLLVFAYEKIDSPTTCILKFLNCTFIDKSRTADFTLTKRLREMLKDGANFEDIIAFLSDRNIPGDEITLSNLAEEILNNPPQQGYLTISNALQWRLQYSRVLALKNTIDGVVNYEC